MKVLNALKALLVLAVTSTICLSLNGCLALAAGAGAAGGYLIGKESEENKHTDVHVHEDHYHTTDAPPSN